MAALLPTVRTSSTGGGTGSTGAVITKPTGLAVGELMLAWCVSSALGFHGNSLTAPDGTWIQLQSQSTDSGGTQFCSFWKIADANDILTSSFRFYNASSNSSGDVVVAGIAVLNTIDLVNPFPTMNIGANDNTFASSVAGGGITIPTTMSGIFIILASGANTTASRTLGGYSIVTSNPSWTEQWNKATAASNDRGVAAMATATPTGAIGTTTGNSGATFSGNELNAAIQLIFAQAPLIYPSATDSLTCSEDVKVQVTSFVSVNDALTKTESLTIIRFDRRIEVFDAPTIAESLTVIDSNPVVPTIIENMTIIEDITPIRFRLTGLIQPFGRVGNDQQPRGGPGGDIVEFSQL